MIVFKEIWRPSVYEMADLPGHLVAITTMCTTKFKHFYEIGTRGERNFEIEFSGLIFWFLEEMIFLLTKLEHRIFRETTVAMVF